MKTVTFAVPSYNSEQYLEKCLNSFCVEALMERFEVIVVNDGSTDSTSAIAETYANRYPNCFRLINKENGGHGSGINCAVEQAQGKYFKVVDSDDWIVSENLERYLDALEKSEADVVLNEFHTVNMSNGQIIHFPLPRDLPGRPLDMREFMEVYPRLRDCCSFHGISYKTQMYRKTNFSLTEHVFYEDQEYASVFFCRAESVLILPFALYQYLIGNAQQSVAVHNQVKRISHIETVMVNILDFWERVGPLSEEAELFMSRKMATFAASYYSVALIKNPDKAQGRAQAAGFSRLLLEKRPELYALTRKKRRTMQLFNYLKLSPKLYQRLLDSKFYRKIRDIWT